MTEPVGQSPALTASLELLAAALCHDAQVEGYDHGSNPTLVSFSPAYCPRHLGIAADVRRSLATVRPPGDEAGLRAAIVAYLDVDDAMPEVKPDWQPTDEWDADVARHRAARARLDAALYRAALAAKPEQPGDEAGLRAALTKVPIHRFAETEDNFDAEGYRDALIDAALAAEPDQEEPGLDVAWAEAEAALPEEAWVEVSGPFPAEVHPDRRYVAKQLRVRGLVVASLVPWCYGPTPAAALRALAARLANPEAGS